jgi:hypothetical protein
VYLLYLKKQEDIYKNKRNNIDNVLTCNDYIKNIKKISPLLVIILITQTIISNNNTNNTIITC